MAQDRPGISSRRWRDLLQERKSRVKLRLLRLPGNVLLAALALGACQQQQSPQTPPSEAATAAPEAKPGIAVSDGVSLMGQNGDSMDTWCVWVKVDGGTFKDWQATPSGVSSGTCGLG